VGVVRSEEETRHIPWAQVEVSYARNRNPIERVAVTPGDRVYYRRDNWDPNLVLAQVLEVQDLGDRTDPNLWQQVRNVGGSPVLDPLGQLVHAPVADPWPWVILQPDDTPGRTAKTWEARLRGSAGWLPLDWRTRHVRLPREVVLRPLQPLTTNPRNLPQRP
jgi:hypothetical protein